MFFRLIFLSKCIVNYTRLENPFEDRPINTLCCTVFTPKPDMTDIKLCSKWFEPRSISSSCSEIVRVSVVLKRTVGDSD